MTLSPGLLLKTLPLALLLAVTRLPADETPVLPDSITYALDARHPGWHVAPLRKELIPRAKRTEYTNFLHADFNRDGALDYAFQVNYIDSQNNVSMAALVFLAKGNDYQEYSLIEVWLGPDHKQVYEPSETVLRWVPKGTKGYRVGGDEDTPQNAAKPAPLYRDDAIEIITLDKEAVVTLIYDQKEKGFRQIRKANESQDRE